MKKENIKKGRNICLNKFVNISIFFSYLFEILGNRIKNKFWNNNKNYGKDIIDNDVYLFYSCYITTRHKRRVK